MDYTPILLTAVASLFAALTTGIFLWRLKTGKAHFNSFSADHATSPKEFWTIQALIAVPALAAIWTAIWCATHIRPL